MADATTSLQSSPTLDPNGNTVTNTQIKTIYTSPVNSVYNASVKIRTTLPTATFSGIIFERYGSSPSTASIENLTSFNSVLVNGVYEFDLTWAVYLDAGDRLAVGLINIPEIRGGSYFQVNDLDFIEKTYESSENYLVSSSFNYHLTPDDWQNFLDDRHGLITATYSGGGQVKGYLKEAIRDFESGLTEWKISSTFNTA